MKRKTPKHRTKSDFQPKRTSKNSDERVEKKPFKFTDSDGKKTEEKTSGMRLNKYVAHAGISSRRNADVHIKDGKVTVNGEVVLEMGFKVQKGDVVAFEGKVLSPEKKVYVLLNKPKGFITTTSDERDRKTVMDLVKKSSPFRMYPVGRLDRNTTGLLMLTNDGDLAQNLAHPSKSVKKLYHATLDKPLREADLKKIEKGLVLEDGPVMVDDVAYVEKSGQKEVGLEIHLGRNRIVRRIFEHLGYEVVKLDRVIYAHLTKKDLPRGKWRYLSAKEVLFLKQRKK